MDIFTEQLSKKELGLIDYIIIFFVVILILSEVFLFEFNLFLV